MFLKVLPFTPIFSGWRISGFLLGGLMGTYRPQQPVDRGAMAAYFYRLAGSPEVALPEISPFKDVDSSHPFYKEIVWMSQQGITTGYEDGTYRPGISVDRGAMAAFFFRYAKVTNYEAPQTPQFKDVDRNNPFYREISWFKTSTSRLAG